ncbi:MAG: glutaredoxin family protein [Bacillota bacterium]
MPEVTVYTTPACPWCNRVKSYLSDKGISYREIDVAAEPEQARRMVEKTGQRTVPVIEIGDDVVIGFDRERLEELL